MTTMFNIMLIICVIIFMTCWIVMRNIMKRQNPKYTFFDDLLYFTGAPAVLGYIIFICLTIEKYADKTPKEVFGTTLIWCLCGWMVLSTIIYLIRYYKKDKNDLI